MIQSYHHGRFEFFVCLIVISIIALAGLGRYSFMAEDARILRLEVLSHHFMTGAANIRVQFLMEKMAGQDKPQKQYLMVADKALYFSAQGWPVSVQGIVADDYQPTDEDCYQLWQLMLQNPAPITKGYAALGNGEYRVIALGRACRYQFEEGDAYFDYFPMDGRMSFSGSSSVIPQP